MNKAKEIIIKDKEYLFGKLKDNFFITIKGTSFDIEKILNVDEIISFIGKRMKGMSIVVIQESLEIGWGISGMIDSIESIEDFEKLINQGAKQ